jgi:hypothetical protein
VGLLLGFIGGLAAVALKGLVDLYFEWRREQRCLGRRKGSKEGPDVSVSRSERV